jgi:hypothetical protein
LILREGLKLVWEGLRSPLGLGFLVEFFLFGMSVLFLIRPTFFFSPGAPELFETEAFKNQTLRIGLIFLCLLFIWSIILGSLWMMEAGGLSSTSV